VAGSKLRQRSIPPIFATGAPWALAASDAIFPATWVNSLPQRKIVGNTQKYRQQLETIQQRREAA
jgi:hypothetical protein